MDSAVFIWDRTYLSGDFEAEIFKGVWIAGTYDALPAKTVVAHDVRLINPSIS